MLKTRLTEMLGMEHPIMQGEMHGASMAELVSRMVAEAEEIINQRLRGMSKPSTTE
jgi:NAD(P)H-dependent flavin oxidoreductase YrpB (nitropropane dioxygenase family)